MSTFDLFIECAESAKTRISDAIMAAYDGDGEACNLAVKDALRLIRAMGDPLAPPDSQREPQ